MWAPLSGADAALTASSGNLAFRDGSAHALVNGRLRALDLPHLERSDVRPWLRGWLDRAPPLSPPEGRDAPLSGQGILAPFFRGWTSSALSEYPSQLCFASRLGRLMSGALLRVTALGLAISCTALPQSPRAEEASLMPAILEIPVAKGLPAPPGPPPAPPLALVEAAAGPSSELPSGLSLDQCRSLAAVFFDLPRFLQMQHASDLRQCIDAATSR